jgi:tRNA(Arg) A34 adenosine deaminase TadA
MRPPQTTPPAETVRIRCLDLAWRSLRHATLPIGALLTGPDGDVVAEGSGRMLEAGGGSAGGGSVADGGPLAGSPVAHAELNVLAQLDARRRYPDHILHTSLEPCLMCAGAAGMAGVGTVAYLGADPYAGATGHYQPTPYLRELPTKLCGPEPGEDPGELGRLAMALHVAFYLRHAPNAGAIATHERRAPQVMPLARRVAGLPDDTDLSSLLALVGR